MSSNEQMISEREELLRRNADTSGLLPYENNMENLSKIIDIAKDLNLSDDVRELEKINKRLSLPNKELILPLVGEFSAGKTSLINALTDSKGLEVASTPTTATIYNIRFGQEKNFAVVYDKNGNAVKECCDFSELKNAELGDMAVVHIFDTSKKVSKSTIILDTPGLSSGDSKHQEALLSCFPLADAFLMVSDIEQALPDSLLEFAEMSQLAKKQIFLILTKIETKTKNEIEAVKKYILEDMNIKLPIGKLACVSSEKNELSELLELFEHIQKHKNEIVNKSARVRIGDIAKGIIANIDEVLKAKDFNDDELNSRIKELDNEIEQLQRAVDYLIKDAKTNIDDLCNKSRREFKDRTFGKLNNIAQQKDINYQEKVKQAVNTASTLILGNFKRDLTLAIRSIAEKRKADFGDIQLDVFNRLDIDNISLDDLGELDANLSECGNETVKIASKSLILIKDAIMFYKAAGKKAALEAGKEAAKQGTKVLVKEAGKEVTEKVFEKTILGKILSFDDKLIEGFTETVMKDIIDVGKSQRHLAIRNYMDSILPQFETQINTIKEKLVYDISNLFKEDIKLNGKQLKDLLTQTKSERKNKSEEHEQRMLKLADFRKQLTTEKENENA
ncbi:MAG: dynamin family protein [Fibromonadales bacterium]|nr:dynamin family protein [Fibromonadales bacterium]